ncbi:O-antigen ligase family protein [Salipiger pacificus]|nr:O-antigen ligase family protein [Alloyangia pacifica]
MKIRIPRLATLYVALIPLVVLPTPAGKIGAVDLLLPFALISILTYRSRQITIPETFLAFFGFFAFLATIFNIQLGVAPPSALMIVRVLAIFLPLVAVLGQTKFDDDDLWALTKVFLVSGGLALIIGIVMHHLGIQVRDDQQRNWYGNGLGQSLRAGGLLGNTGGFGHLASVWGVVCAGVLLLRGKFRFAAAVLALALYATYISTSRAAFIHITVSLLFFLPIIFGGRRLISALVALPILGLGGFYWALGVDLSPQAIFALRRLDVLNVTGETLFFKTARFDNWANYLGYIFEHPLLGIGFKNTENMIGTPGDNSFVTIALELGVICGILYAAFWIWLALRFKRAEGARSLVGMAVVFGEIAHAMTLDTHTLWISTPAALLFIAALIRTTPQNSSHVPARSQNTEWLPPSARTPSYASRSPTAAE